MLVLYGVSYAGIVSSTQSNISGELYFDLFIITCLTQILVSFTDWAWYILLIIPAYGIYQAIIYFISSKSTKNKIQENTINTKIEDDDNANKKMKASERLKLQRLKKN
jgi:hypothetical protein